MIYIAGSGVALGAMFVWFHRLETLGRRHTIVLVLVGVLLADALLTGPSAQVPVGIFRPRMLGQDFRAPDLVIIAALSARVLMGNARRMGPIGLTWVAFLFYFASGVVVGILRDLPIGQVLFQGKMVFYIAGAAIVATGADLERLVDGIGRLARWLAPVVPIGLIVTTTQSQFSVSTPLQRFNGIGRLSNDTITMLVVIGAAAMLVEAVRLDGPRRSVFLASFLLMLAPLAGRQRASYLVLGVVVAGLVIVMLGSAWRRRSQVSPVEIALAVAAMAAVFGIGMVVTETPAALVSKVDLAFGGVGNEQSANARVSLADEAWKLIGEHPVLGNGVGATVSASVDAGSLQSVAAHNLVLDTLMRVGVVGLALLLLALAVTTWTGVGLWRRSVDRVRAVAALAGVLVIGGVVAKAMVEPALEKYRLSCLVGLAIGVVAAAWRREREHQEAIGMAPAVADPSLRRERV